MLRILSLTAFILWTLFWFPPVAAAYFLKKKKLRGRMARFASAGMVRLLGVHVHCVGELSGVRPLMIVSNHLSYIDILVLASQLDCRFVPKKEIAGWPVINLICKIMNVVYVDRRPGKINEGNHAIASALAEGEVVALFPEATTSDGRHLLPFKPAFFEAAQAALVQPVAIAYRKIRGLPIDYGQWPLIAWYGDMTLLPHVWKLLSLGRIDVELIFLPPIKGEDRKILSYQSHDSIQSALLVQN